MSEHRLKPVYDAHLVKQAVDLHDDLVQTIHILHQPRRHGDLGEILFRLAFPATGSWTDLANDLATASSADEKLHLWVPGDDPRLNTLPWEYLRVPDSAAADFDACGVTLESRFLALHPHCLIVRDETSGRVTPARRPLARLRVLIAWANPGVPPDWPALDSFADEAARVRRALQGLDETFIEVRELPNAGVVVFQEAIAAFRPHVIHFCGHGHHPDYTGPPAAPREPALVCGQAGVPEYFTASALAAACQDFPPDVAVLNCCFAGFSTAFAPGFAQRLLAGLARPPVVVAYQMPATDSSAAGLAYHLYKGLRNVPVEDAVADYRRYLASIHSRGDGTPEWGAPVVYLPHPGGVRLFDHTVTEPYPRDFRGILAEYGELVGRRALLDQWRDWSAGLLAARGGGIFLLTGLPGVGKTALLWDAVRPDPDNTPHYFYRATASTCDPGECLRSLYRTVQRICGWTEEPHYTTVGLADLLRRAGQAALERGEVLTVVIDALDEASAGVEFGALDVIPSPVPPGVCLLVSSRPGAAVDALRDRGVQPVDLVAEDYLEDARAACEIFLGAACPAEMLGAGDRVKALAAQMAERAGGNFLVLTSFFKAHAGTGRSLDELAGAAEDLTSSVSGVYASFFRRMQGDPDLDHVYEVLTVMVSAHGAVTRSMVCRAFGLRTGPWEKGMLHARQFLVEGGYAGEDTYRLYHETFREFCLMKFESDLPEARERWASYTTGWRGLGGYARRYALENLPAHLPEAGRRDDLARLFLDLEFAERRCAEFGPYGYTALFRDVLDGDEVTRAVERTLDQTTHLQVREPELWLQHVQNALQQRLGESERMVRGVACGRQWLRLTNRPPLGSAAALIRTIEHEHEVSLVTWSPDGAVLASKSGDNTVMVWEARTGRLLHTLEGQGNSLPWLAYSPDWAVLAGRSRDETLKLWEARTGSLNTRQRFTLAFSSLADSPDGAVVASWEEPVLMGRTPHRDSVPSVEFAVKLWKARTGRLLHTLKGHAGTVSLVAYAPDGSVLASGSHDKTVKLWEVGTGRLLNTLRGHVESVLLVAYSPDGAVLASGSEDQTVKLWEARTGRLRHTLAGHKGRVTSVAYSPDGAVMASGSVDHTVKLWETRSGRLLHTLAGHKGRVTSVAYAPDGSVLASGSKDSTVKVWEAHTNRPPQTPEACGDRVRSVAYPPDATVLAGGSKDNTVKVWEARSGRLLHTLAGHTGRVISVAYSPDGSVLASGSSDNTAKLWQARTGLLLHTLAGHKDGVISMAYAPDGSVLATGSKDHTVKVWEARTGRLLHTLGPGSFVASLAYSPDGVVLASGSGDGTVKLWEARTGRLTGRLLQIFEGHSLWGGISLAYAPDGAVLASGSGENATVNLWEVSTGRLLQTLRGHGVWVNSVAYAPDGAVLASASMDGDVHVWDTRTGQCLCRREFSSRILALHFAHPRRLFVAEAGEAGVPRHWDFLIEDPR